MKGFYLYVFQLYFWQFLLKLVLSDYTNLDYEGRLKSGAEIIYQAAQEYEINPKFILVMLQKEQSLIENPAPTQYNYDWAMGYARCDDCDPEHPVVAKYKGFGKQVDSGTWRQTYYIENSAQEWLKQVGQTYDIDGYQITPQTQATANLYTYTPHYFGNYNFWRIWKRWFTKIYPDGSLLQAKGEHGVWYIQFGKRRPVLSKTALVSRFDTSKIIAVSKTDLDQYATGQAIKFAQYSLLRSPAGTVYLLADDKLRGIASPEVFKMIGFNPEEIIDLPQEEINGYPLGESITIESIYPLGALLQDKTTGGVYYVKDAIKNPIWSKELMQKNYPSRKLTPVSPEELEKYPTGEPVKFKDGELVMSDSSPAVYVISNGEKRAIASGEVFESLGYKWDNIIRTNNKVLEIHSTGEMIVDTSLAEEEEEEVKLVITNF